MSDDVIINKCAIIERCLQRIDEEYKDHESELATNFTKQDSIILNLQRACEAAIDLGTYITRKKRLGVPQSSREVFVLLEQGHLIKSGLSKNLQSMVGFRNIVVHAYQALSIEVLRTILDHRLSDFYEYTKTLLNLV